jgi:glycosyltransferase involved in cell wall biosynthesis
MKILIDIGHPAHVHYFKHLIKDLKRKGKGVLGYISNYRSFRQKIKNFAPDIVHAHYGLSGVLSVLQRKVPVVVTFHGSDIHQNKNLRFSKFAIKFSATQIFVSQKLKLQANCANGKVIPCGIDISIFYPRDKNECRKRLSLNMNAKYILFASSFDNPIKNYQIAKNAVKMIGIENLEALELKGYSRDEVAILMNAVDLLLMTSFSEGSPQVIKEALASNLSIVSTGVGDVKEVLGNMAGSYIVEYKPADVCNKLQLVFKNERESSGQSRISHLQLSSVADSVINVYEEVLDI